MKALISHSLLVLVVAALGAWGCGQASGETETPPNDDRLPKTDIVTREGETDPALREQDGAMLRCPPELCYCDAEPQCEGVDDPAFGCLGELNDPGGYGCWSPLMCNNLVREKNCPQHYNP